MCVGDWCCVHLALYSDVHGFLLAVQRDEKSKLADREGTWAGLNFAAATTAQLAQDHARYFKFAELQHLVTVAGLLLKKIT